MKKALMSAAFAATMACGWAGQAAAATYSADVSIYGGSPFTSGNAFGLNASAYPIDASLSVAQTGNKPPNQAYSILSLSLSLAGFTFSAADVTGIGDFPNGLVINFQQGDVSGSLGVQDNGKPGTFFISRPDGFTGTAPNYDTFGCNFCVNVVSQSGVSLVPLPSSAPLFGAGLLALAAAGYGARRKQAPQI